MKIIQYKPIGVIRTPFKVLAGMPIQPVGARRTRGIVELAADYEAALEDVEGFSHIILLYHFHRSRGYSLRVTPFLDSRQRGLFATRAPKRPNPIGLSIVHLVQITGLALTVEGIDVLDGTPLLDIKPYVPAFDRPRLARVGWLTGAQARARSHRADSRFQ